MPWITLLSYALQIAAATADPPVPAAATAEWTSRETAVPIQVLGPGDERPARRVEISVVALGQEAGHARRGKPIARAATGPKGEPCVVRLAPSLDPALIEARQVGENGPALGSAVITFDRDRSVWRGQTGLVGGATRPSRAAELLEKRPSQPTISVRIPERAHTRVYVVASHYERLPNFAEVMVFATNGKCIRRGFPRASGEGFDAERDRPLDPRYQRLLVVARGWQNGQLLTGSMLLVFDHNNWRPATRYDDFVVDPGKRSGLWRPAADYDPVARQFEPILDGALWSPSQIRIPVPAHPLPLWKPGESVDGWHAQNEVMGVGVARPRPSLRSGTCHPCGEEAGEDALPTPASACCQETQETAEGDILKQFGFTKEALSGPEIEELAAREAGIVEAGRPLSAGHRWADFGRRWVRGPSNMCWQAAIDSGQP